MYLYGARGHAKVIIEILEAQGISIEGLFDDNVGLKSLLDYPVFQWNQELDKAKSLIISIGNNNTRQKIAVLTNTEYGTAIHPQSILSKRITVGEGSVIMGGVTINVDSHIGKHCIVNTNASIDHECVLENFVHISPNVVLCGNVQVGEGTHIGAGSAVIPGKRIGKWCIIGAGAVVINDLPDYSTVVGNPGKIIKSSS